MTDLDGSPLGLEAHKILASNGKLHSAMRVPARRAESRADRPICADQIQAAKIEWQFVVYCVNLNT